MIQEFFDGTSIGGVEASDRRSIAFNNGGGGILLAGAPATSPSPSSSSTSSVAAALTATTTASNQETQNLRCPRCDSSNTKFCYYNNYNLTQPRHFCKTCRRYWTKGGALRNVPIGGGCRKNKASIHLSSSATKSTVGKFKSLPDDMGGFETVNWVSPQSSQFLAFLRNPNPNPSLMKEEEGNIFETNMVSRGLGFDPLIGQLPSFWRNNGNYHHHSYDQPHEVQNQSAMQALYQRIKLSTTNPNLTQMASSSSIMEEPLMATPATSADQMVYLQNSSPTFCWSDLPTTTLNGAYP